MAYEIIWTENAKEDFKRIIEYLQAEWSITIAENFTEKLLLKIELLTKYPFIGIASVKSPQIRSVLITKHNLLFYKVGEDTITLLLLFR